MGALNDNQGLADLQQGTMQMLSKMCQHMTKPTKWHVHPGRLRSTLASTQSDQSLHLHSMGS